MTMNKVFGFIQSAFLSLLTTVHAQSDCGLLVSSLLRSRSRHEQKYPTQIVLGISVLYSFTSERDEKLAAIPII